MAILAQVHSDARNCSTSACSSGLAALAGLPASKAALLGHDRTVGLPALTVTIDDLYSACQIVGKACGLTIGGLIEQVLSGTVRLCFHV